MARQKKSKSRRPLIPAKQKLPAGIDKAIPLSPKAKGLLAQFVTERDAQFTKDLDAFIGDLRKIDHKPERDGWKCEPRAGVWLVESAPKQSASKQ